jgi:adenylate kinase
MVVIVITGVPGSGKTTLAKELSKRLKARVINILDFAKSQNLHLEYDEAYQTFVVDENVLIRKLSEHIKNSEDNVIVEGTFAHLLPKELVDLFILLKADPNDLYKRLSQRKYPYHKIFENIWAQNLEVIESELEEESKPYITFDTSKETPEEIANKIIRYINNKK